MMTTTTPLHALVVEDDETINMLVTLTLEVHGFTVTSAYNGAQAISAGGCEQFAVAIVDLGLPDQSGLTVCQRLRERCEDGLVIIVLTASDSLSDLERAFSVGADDFVPKPFYPRELISRIRARLSNARSPAVA